MRTCTPGKESAFSLKMVPRIRKLGTGLSLPFFDEEEEEDDGVWLPGTLEEEGVEGVGEGGSWAQQKVARNTTTRTEAQGFIRLQLVPKGPRQFR